MTLQPAPLYDAFGLDKGKPFDDAKLGEIEAISKIELSQGWLLDGISVTYVLKNGEHKTAHHMGTAKPNAHIDFLSTEILIGLTGKVGLPGYYEDKPYLNSVRFIILNKQTGTVRVEGPFGAGADKDFEYRGNIFSIVGEIKHFAGLEFHEKNGDPENALTLVFPESQVASILPYINPGGPIIFH